jgi:hypothetical protein
MGLSSERSVKVISKKRKNPTPIDIPNEDVVIPEVKKPKTKRAEYLEIRETLSAYLTLYSQQGMNLTVFIQNINKFWGKGSHGSRVEFLRYFFPHSQILYGSALREAFKLDEFFEWVLSELELCIEEAPTESLCFISAILNKVTDTTRVSTLLSRPSINEFFFNHGIYLLVTQVVEHDGIQIKPWALIEQYFSSDQREQLKTKPLIIRETEDEPSEDTLLDVLVSTRDLESALTFWENGFRPSSQEDFNSRFFSAYDYGGDKATRASNGVVEIYKMIASNAQYSDLLVFPAECDPLVLFLGNAAIDKAVLVQLLERKALTPDLQALMAIIIERMRGKFNQHEFTHFFEKITYVVSSFNLQWSQPADPSFLNYVKERIVLGMGIVQHSWYLETERQLCQVELLQIGATLADELLFYCANLKGKDKFFIPIAIYQHLQAQQVEQARLWRTLLNAHFIQLSSMSDKKTVGTNLTKTLKTFSKLTPDITPEEKQQLIIDYIAFAADILEKWNRRYVGVYKEKRSLDMKIQINHFLTFLAGLMNTIPGEITISQESYYHLATFLWVQLAHYTDEKENRKSTIKTFFSYFNVNRNHSEHCAQIAAHLLTIAGMNSMVDKEFISLFSEIEPSWICHIPNEFSLNGKAHNVLSSLVQQLPDKKSGVAEQSAHTISYLLGLLLDKKEMILPLDFLKEIANWKHDLQKKASLTPETQELLETIYNQCIHKVQGTAQEPVFEEIRTQLLLKFDANPANGTQAIHTRENHLFADTIYAAWMKAWMEKPAAERAANFNRANELFATYRQQEKDKKTVSLSANMDVDKLRNYLLYLGGQERLETPEFKRMHSQISLYTKGNIYFADLLSRSNKPITPEMPESEKRVIVDARKLCNTLLLAVHFSSSEHQPESPFALHKTPEVLNILLLELLDQVEHPSCDQGPFIRILMALEPVAGYQFPYLTRRTIHFYIKEYINNYFDQLPPEEKDTLINLMYEQIEDKATLEEVDFIPENTLTFLAERFITQNKKQLGFITEQEINNLFSMERPEAYHPKIVESLKKLHQEYRSIVLSSATYNSNRFFMNKNVAEPSMDVDIDIFMQDPDDDSTFMEMGGPS